MSIDPANLNPEAMIHQAVPQASSLIQILPISQLCATKSTKAVPVRKTARTLA